MTDVNLAEEPRDDDDFFRRLHVIQDQIDGIPIDDAMDVLAWSVAGVLVFVRQISPADRAAMRLAASLATFVAHVQNVLLDLEEVDEVPAEPGETLQ